MEAAPINGEALGIPFKLTLEEPNICENTAAWPQKKKAHGPFMHESCYGTKPHKQSALSPVQTFMFTNRYEGPYPSFDGMYIRSQNGVWVKNKAILTVSPT